MCQLNDAEICEGKHTPPHCDDLCWWTTWWLERGMVVKGNGVEETTSHFGTPAIGRLVMVLDKSDCNQSQHWASKQNQNNQLPQQTQQLQRAGRCVMMEDVGTKQKIVGRQCYDGKRENHHDCFERSVCYDGRRLQ